MSYVVFDNSAQSRFVGMKTPTNHARSRVTQLIQRWCLLNWLLHCCTSDFVVLARVSATTFRLRDTNLNVDTSEEINEVLNQLHLAEVMPHETDTVLPSAISPNLHSSRRQSEETLLESERRTQENTVSCSANPVCADSGLVDDCCPTRAGDFLSCCEAALPPMMVPTPPPIPLPSDPPIQPPTDVPNPPPFFETAEPSASPVRIPTAIPVLSPTLTPVRPPTPTPVLPPTVAPSALPTTNIPIVTPTTLPPETSPPVSLLPIPTPTEMPQAIILPTFTPTTLSPTPLVFTPNTTSPPSMTTTIVVNSSETPSSAPSAFFQYRVTTLSIRDVQLTLRSESSVTRRKLQDDESNCTQILQDLLIERMETEVDSIIKVYELLYIEIQNFTAPFTNATVRTYIYDVLMDIRSPMEEHDPNRYVEGSVLSQVQKNLFAQELRSTDCPEFQDVTGVTIAIPRTMENKSPDTRKATVQAGLVTGVVAGCAALMILLGAVFIGARIRKRNRLLDDDSSPEPFASTNNKRPIRKSDENYNMSAMDNYEVSTLGDPIISERGNGLTIEDSTIGSANNEYDYRRAYGDVNSMTDSQLVESSDDSSPHRRSHRFGSLDDPSLQNGGAGGSASDIVTAAGDGTIGSPFYVSEEQFDVVAPAGLLGLILETNIEDGRPMVFSIKPSSSLAHILKVGDRLIALDGTDVSTIRASDVSRMIAEKKDKTRHLVFSRLVKGNVIPNRRY